ncbi:endolytic transglycosylase MltG [Sinomonas notoginsengisoli]|uniref:endolytic transglycosylase MltG n=1 Tax=Sinomonas notoginsengisoli TaxID=1457311 RepID=UPI0027E09A61|nr:endolytic transglycosylase MltG [Sinomonas notoginsengisoli]
MITGPQDTPAAAGHHPVDGLEGILPGQDPSEKPIGEPVPEGNPGHRRRRRFRIAVTALGVLIVLTIAASVVVALVLRSALKMDRVTDYPGPGTGEVHVSVQKGTGPLAVAKELEQEGVVADADAFLRAFAETGGKVSPGDFTFKKEMKASDAAQILAGNSSDKIVYFALSAGMRINESLDAIAKASSADRKDLDALNSRPGDFGLPAGAKTLEGYLAPGEYRFPVGTSSKDIVAKLVATTVDELKQDGITDPAQQYQVLTVASIVQAEGGRADYGTVAGAINNRLKPNDQTGGLLQSDASVTYGLGTRTVQLTDVQKQDANNPYNTYAHPGLPPGPIDSPGSKAIAAAAHPTANDYLYWVTVNLDTGETKFAKTYAEHKANVAQYQQWCTANPGKCS